MLLLLQLLLHAVADIATADAVVATFSFDAVAAVAAVAGDFSGGGNGAGSLSVICSRCLLVVVVQNV